MTTVSTIQAICIEVDGLSLDAVADEALREISIRQRLLDSSLCILTFVEPEGANFIMRSRLLPGVRLILSRQDNQQIAFSGTIKGFQYYYGPAGERVVKVSANDDLYLLKKRQQVKSHIQITVTELAATMLADFGLSVVAQETGPVWDHIVQFQDSDLAFLQEYAERSGFYFFLLADALHFYRLQPAQTGISLEYRQSLLEVTMKNNSDWSIESLSVKGWNPWRANVQTGRAQGVLNPHQELNDGGFATSRILCDQPAQTDEQLDALATAELYRAASHQLAITGTAEGNFELTPGTTVRIEGLDASLNGLYLLASTEHRINADQGFVTVFDSTPPKPVTRLHHTMATLAFVTQVEDPEWLGRVKVTLPGYNDVESDWLEVVIPGAGVNKGLMAFPDIDDQVLVLMLNGRPDQAIVIGGLYGEKGPPDQNVQNNAKFRYSFLTPGGQSIHMNDLGDKITVANNSGSRVELNCSTIKLETSGGQVLEMNDQSLILHAQTDLNIEAPGRTLTLKADKINFERG